MLEWPGNSPDLIPIENLSSKMKGKVAEQQPSSLLRATSCHKSRLGENLYVKYCTKLILSMPRRIKSVIKCKGGHTKY